MPQEKKSITVLRIASGLAMLFVSFCFFGILFMLIHTYPNAPFTEIWIPLSIFISLGSIPLFIAWNLLRDGFSSTRETLLPKWFFVVFGIFILFVICVAGYSHPASIIPVIVAVLFTAITYKYRKK